ncbi:MAG: phage protein GemA/Gp16 family protein [Campylobacterota bacterium]
MTKKQREAHASLVKQVHTSIRYKNYYRDNREEYVRMIEDAFGKKSSRDLSVSDLIALVDYLNMRRDWLPTFKPRQATPAQVWKIMQAWDAKARDKSDTALLNFCRRIIKKEYESPDQMTFNEAQKVILALENMK